MHYDMQVNQSGYVHSRHVGALSDQAAGHTKRTGCAPIFLFSQEIVLDPQPTLNTISLHLYNQGIIAGTKVHTISLLVLLSSGRPLRELLQSILQQARHNDGLIFIEDAYRYDYDSARAFDLLDNLAQEYAAPQSLCPLVMKTPPPTDQKLLYHCTSFRNNCFHLSAEPICAKWTSAPPANPAVQKPAQSAAPQHQQMPRRESTRQERTTKAAKTTPAATGLWYETTPGLLQSEWKGLSQFLISINCSARIDEPALLPYTGRICIQVQLNIGEVGRCTLRVVYADTFRAGRDGDVSIAVSTYDKRQLQRRLSRVARIFDHELQGHLFSPTRSAQILHEYGAAAATVDGFIRAMV